MEDWLLTVRLLTPLYGEGEAKSVASIVFEDEFGIKKSAQRALTAAEKERLSGITQRLLAGKPLQYVLGMADFFGMKLVVNPDVLIPRQETEELVAWAIDFFQKKGQEAAQILDVGAGSGCIALALKRRFPRANVTALDVSEKALDVARQNAAGLGLELVFFQSDFLQDTQWPPGSFDLIISNPPYVTPSETAHMPQWVLAHEPERALFAPEEEPLVFYKQLLRMAADRLNPGGALLVELNAFRAQEVGRLFLDAGFENVEVRQDLSRAMRMAGGVKAIDPASINR